MFSKSNFFSSAIRSTRKIKKKRHKYGEDDVDDELAIALSEAEEGSRSATPVRGPPKAAKRILQTPASTKKSESFYMSWELIIHLLQERNKWSYILVLSDIPL